VCPNARFVFDDPVAIPAGEETELDNGQWFLIKPASGAGGKEKRIQLHGKWDR